MRELATWKRPQEMQKLILISSDEPFCIDCFFNLVAQGQAARVGIPDSLMY